MMVSRIQLAAAAGGGFFRCVAKALPLPLGIFLQEALSEKGFLVTVGRHKHTYADTDLC